MVYILRRMIKFIDVLNGKIIDGAFCKTLRFIFRSSVNAGLD